MPSVEIYTKMSCSFCTRAKRLLEAKGVEYTEHAVDFGGALRQQMIERARGRSTVPQVFIGDRHVGGCDELMSLERSGELDDLLAA